MISPIPILFIVTLIFLELIDEVVDEGIVEIFSAEQRVTIRWFDLYWHKEYINSIIAVEKSKTNKNKNNQANQSSWFDIKSN